MEFTCTITNLIQNNLTLRIEWKSLNAIDADLRTHLFVIEGNGDKTIAFAGTIVEKGEILSVIETKELGSTSSLAYTTISIEAINSTQGETFSDVAESLKLSDHIQELSAIGVCLILIAALGLNARSSAKKKKAARRAEMMQVRASSFSHEESLFGRGPPMR